jgi:hypothetical protein
VTPEATVDEAVGAGAGEGDEAGVAVVIELLPEQAVTDNSAQTTSAMADRRATDDRALAGMQRTGIIL